MISNVILSHIFFFFSWLDKANNEKKMAEQSKHNLTTHTHTHAPISNLFWFYVKLPSPPALNTSSSPLAAT